MPFVKKDLRAEHERQIEQIDSNADGRQLEDAQLTRGAEVETAITTRANELTDRALNEETDAQARENAALRAEMAELRAEMQKRLADRGGSIDALAADERQSHDLRIRTAFYEHLLTKGRPVAIHLFGTGDPVKDQPIQFHNDAVGTVLLYPGRTQYVDVWVVQMLDECVEDSTPAPPVPGRRVQAYDLDESQNIRFGTRRRLAHPYTIIGEEEAQVAAGLLPAMQTPLVARTIPSAA